MKYSFKVNGKKIVVKAHPMERVLDVLRERLNLTGTKEGCGEGECGACSILVDGKLANSCLIPVMQVDGTNIKTIEGVKPKTNKLHAIQEAFIDSNGAQCGMCTPGMILATLNLLEKNKTPTLDEIKDGLAGNLCRCTGYMKIFDAVLKCVKKKIEK